MRGTGRVGVGLSDDDGGSESESESESEYEQSAWERGESKVAGTLRVPSSAKPSCPESAITSEGPDNPPGCVVPELRLLQCNASAGDTCGRRRLEFIARRTRTAQGETH